VGDGSPRLHVVLPAYRPSLDPVRLPTDISAALRLVLSATAVDDVLPIKVEHDETGRLSDEHHYVTYCSLSFICRVRVSQNSKESASPDARRGWGLARGIGPYAPPLHAGNEV